VTIAALLLAAGESTRMGRLKQLLPWGGTTLLAWQVAQLREAGADEVVVVLGHAAEQIRDAVPAEARVIVNEAYLEGRATSLRRGAEALREAVPNVEAILILSVDQPRPSWLSRLLLDRWRQNRPLVVSPRFQRGYGHPILIDGSLLAELCEVSDETLGLRAVIDRHLPDAREVAVGNQDVDVDLNTPSEYEAGLARFESGSWQAH
jgi:molybdenum cofactor cytidylyltransferase